MRSSSHVSAFQLFHNYAWREKEWITKFALLLLWALVKYLLPLLTSPASFGSNTYNQANRLILWIKKICRWCNFLLASKSGVWYWTWIQDGVVSRYPCMGQQVGWGCVHSPCDWRWITSRRTGTHIHTGTLFCVPLSRYWTTRDFINYWLANTLEPIYMFITKPNMIWLVFYFFI